MIKPEITAIVVDSCFSENIGKIVKVRKCLGLFPRWYPKTNDIVQERIWQVDQPMATMNNVTGDKYYEKEIFESQLLPIDEDPETSELEKEIEDENNR